MLASFFDEHLTFSDQVSAVLYPATCIFINFAASVHILISKQQALLPLLFTLSLTIATHFTMIHLKCQLNRLQLIQNSLARAIIRSSKSSRIIPSLQSSHWLKIKERVDYRILSLTNKVLTTTEPSYLYDVIFNTITAQTCCDVVTLAHPPSYSCLKVNNRSLCHASPHLWNEFPKELHQAVDDESLSLSSHLSLITSSSPPSPPLSLCITPSQFHSGLKECYLFHKFLPP